MTGTLSKMRKYLEKSNGRRNVSAANHVLSLMGTDLLPTTVAKLRTCKEITNFCLINKQSSGMCKGDILNLLRRILVYKGKKFNYESMIQNMLCQVIEMTSSSSLGDYAKGKGMYQDCCKSQLVVLIQMAKSILQRQELSSQHLWELLEI
jgi:hypothetical protein